MVLQIISRGIVSCLVFFRFMHQHTDRRLLHSLRRRLHRRQKWLGPIRNKVRNAHTTTLDPTAHMHLPEKRRNSLRKRDVWRNQRRQNRRRDTNQHRIVRPSQNRCGTWRIRQGHLRKEIHDEDDEIRFLDEWKLQPAS